jgi:hypothetical protein
MTEGKKLIAVTEEEYEVIRQLRERIQGEGAPIEELPKLPEGMKGPEFAMGAVAGMAAYWLYKELFDDEDDDEDEAPKRRSRKKGGKRA